MSATDILNELKTLPPGEQAAFEKLFHQWRSASARPSKDTGNWLDFLVRLRRIYGNKATGDSQSIISELRGDR